MATKVDLKLWHLIFVFVVSLCGVAASWGASKNAVAHAAEDVTSLQKKVDDTTKEIENLKINGAVTNEALKNIDQKLDAIQDDLDKLDKKLDSLRK